MNLAEDLVITTDNSGAIGEKQQDLVQVPDALTAYFAARVTLLEQWATHAEPIAVVLHNFSGSSSWPKYVQGVEKLFHEAGLELPPLSGSSETNMELLQSAMAVTLIGKKKAIRPSAEPKQWYTYGYPLVGKEVLENREKVASLSQLKNAMDNEIVEQIWPVGSQGILHEVRQLTGNETAQIDTLLDATKSAGPATVILLAIKNEKKDAAFKKFGIMLNNLTIIS